MYNRGAPAHNAPFPSLRTRSLFSVCLQGPPLQQPDFIELNQIDTMTCPSSTRMSAWMCDKSRNNEPCGPFTLTFFALIETVTPSGILCFNSDFKSFIAKGGLNQKKLQKPLLHTV